MVTGKDVAEAMRVAAIAILDDRGLMPLGPAREALRGSVFAKGAPRTIGHQVVLESDIMWAALLSLEDAQEFVTYALRMKWDHRPRGRDNTAFVQRYGAGVLPWIASRVDARGHLIDEPACVVACLLAIGTVEALELLLKLAPEDQTQLLGSWVARHADVAYLHLGQLASAGRKDAQAALEMLALDDPAGTHDGLERALGADKSKWLVSRIPHSEKLDPAVGALLDEAPLMSVPSGRTLTMTSLDVWFGELECPAWDNANYFVGAMRASGFVSPSDDAFVLQAVETSPESSEVRREVYVYRGGSPRPWKRSSVLIPDKKLVTWSPDETKLTYAHDGRHGRAWHRSNHGAGRRSEKHIRARPERDERQRPALPRVDGLARSEVAVLAGGLGPMDGLMVSLGQEPFRQQVFLTGQELAESVELPEGSIMAFEFDSWIHPHVMELASTSIDLRVMLEALRRRRAVRRLPKPIHPLMPLVDRIRHLGKWSDGWGTKGSPLLALSRESCGSV